jgi:hypothetical protein
MRGVKNTQSTRRGKINPKEMFLTHMQAIGTKEKHGIGTAIDFINRRLDTSELKPTKGAWSKRNQRISYSFTKSYHDDLVDVFKDVRPRYKGLFIGSIDGDQLNLPRTDELITHGYKGYPCKDMTESYDLTMYTVTYIDSITGVPLVVKHSNTNDEVQRAFEIIQHIDAKSLTIYDRLYISKKLINAHKKTGSFFLFRCKSETTFSEIVAFASSNKTEMYTHLEGVKVRLIKFTPPEGKEEFIFATNLGKRFSKQEIGDLYHRRWLSETYNKEQTETQKLGNFQSKTLNGILHELYANIFLNALTHIIIALETHPEHDFMKDEYKKTNFQSVQTNIIDTFVNLFVKPLRKTWREIADIIEEKMESRIRNSRHYNREVKSRHKNKYPKSKLIPRTE